MVERVTPQQEHLRREMASEGLDPTDPAQREAYEGTLHGAMLNLDESLEQLKRSLPPWRRRLLDWLNKGRQTNG